jgi:hypothetical protein
MAGSGEESSLCRRSECKPSAWRLYNRDEGSRMGAGLIFLWNATRGSRLRPWRSECLKWRVETYTGKHAEEVGLRDFLSFLYAERRQLLRFMQWLTEMRTYAHGAEKQ